jgi:hypothetical protein
LLFILSGGRIILLYDDESEADEIEKIENKVFINTNNEDDFSRLSGNSPIEFTQSLIGEEN